MTSSQAHPHKPTPTRTWKQCSNRVCEFLLHWSHSKSCCCVFLALALECEGSVSQGILAMGMCLGQRGEWENAADECRWHSDAEVSVLARLLPSRHKLKEAAASRILGGLCWCPPLGKVLCDQHWSSGCGFLWVTLGWWLECVKHLCNWE